MTRTVREGAIGALLTSALLFATLLAALLVAPRTAAATGAPTVRATAASSASAQVRVAAIVKQRKRAVRLLDLVNSARRHGRTCGSAFYPRAKPLKYRTSLATAARRHARDMARTDYFDHNSRAGTSPGQRARRAGYHGATGENIAAGYRSVARTMHSWLASPGHCANIMSRRYKHLGIGYAYDASSRYRAYWVQDFGAG